MNGSEILAKERLAITTINVIYAKKRCPMNKPLISDEAMVEIRAVSEANRKRDAPLSETHPTLWFEMDRQGYEMCEELEKELRMFQSCTVDKAEHESVKKQLFDAHQSVMAFKSEVERLKKELENTTTVEKAEFLADFGYNEGLVDGERRAMERVNMVVESDWLNIACPSLSEYDIREVRRYFRKELGLCGEEEKK
jgi:hypothetical protein